MENAVISKIKAEIDKRYAEYREKMKSDDFTYYEGMADALDLFEQFIDTLESEKPMEGLEEEIGAYFKYWYVDESDQGYSLKTPTGSSVIGHMKNVARHFAKWGSEHLATSGKTSGGSSEIPNCLNELADYARRQVEELLPVIKKYDDYSEEQIEELRTHLMAMFLEGAGWQKEQMLKEAVEGKIIFLLNGDVAVNIGDTDKYNLGQKIRVIVLPKED